MIVFSFVFVYYFGGSCDFFNMVDGLEFLLLLSNDCYFFWCFFIVVDDGGCKGLGGVIFFFLGF